MPISIRLIREGHVLLRTLSDPLDVQELFESFRNGAREIIAPAPHTIHLILDATNVRKIPNNLLSLGLGAEKIMHPKTGRVMIVSSSGFVKTMIALLDRVSSLKPIMVETLDEALVIVDRVLAEEKRPLSEGMPVKNMSDTLYSVK